LQATRFADKLAVMHKLTRRLAALLLVTCTCAATSSAAAPGTAPEPAAGRLLVAQRSLLGPFFARTVVYLLQHDVHGSVGLILNRPLDKRAADVWPELRGVETADLPVSFGGPISPQALVILFRGGPRGETALRVRDDIYAGSDPGMLGELLEAGKKEHEVRLFAGRASWTHGQLQQELERQDWYVMAADPDLLFGAAGTSLWQRLINRLDPVGILALQGVND